MWRDLIWAFIGVAMFVGGFVAGHFAGFTMGMEEKEKGRL